MWKLRLMRDPAVGDGGGVAVVAAPPAGAAAASASGTVALPKAGDGTPAATPPAFTVPDAYKTKEYAKSIDSPDKLWAMLDGAQELIGKRPAGIPAPDAPQAEWDKFYEAAGRPKTAAEYAFDYGKDDKGQPKVAADAKWDSALKQMMFEEGITAKQAAGLDMKFNTLVRETLKQKGINEAALNADFDKIGSELYGAERDKVIARVSPLLKEFSDPKMHPGLAKLTPEALMILTNVVDNIRSKFIKGEGAPLQIPAGGQGNTPDALRAEARKLMNDPSYTDAFHPEHGRTTARIQELYKQAAGVR